jgi:hypothetical protein
LSYRFDSYSIAPEIVSADLLGHGADSDRPRLAREYYGAVLELRPVCHETHVASMFKLPPRARESSRRATCQNNLHQLAVAMSAYWQLRGLPRRAAPEAAGGWSVAIMPFQEDRERGQALAHNSSLDPVSMSPWARERPLVMTCPSRDDDDANPPPVPWAHYAMATNAGRDYFAVGDTPLGLALPWAAGLEIEFDAWRLQPGPHEGGCHVANSEGDVKLVFPTAD